MNENARFARVRLAMQHRDEYLAAALTAITDKLRLLARQPIRFGYARSSGVAANGRVNRRRRLRGVRH
jgi:hypothetical protein